jgi:hypothetical protein
MTKAKNKWAYLVYGLIIAVSSVFIVLNVVKWANKKKYSSSGITEVTMDKTIIDFKKVKYKAQIEGSFEISNIGTSNLFIQDVISDCHCTAPYWDTKPISPGSKSIIKVRYDSTIIGSFYKTVKVNVNTKKTPLVLAIKGIVAY